MTKTIEPSIIPPQRGVAILGVGNMEGMEGKEQAQTFARACVPPAARPPPAHLEIPKSGFLGEKKRPCEATPHT